MRKRMSRQENNCERYDTSIGCLATSYPIDLSTYSLQFVIGHFDIQIMVRSFAVFKFPFLFKNAKYSIHQHKKMQDRIEAARILARQCSFAPVYADLMDNRVNKAFGAMPERLFILLNDEVIYEGGMGPFFYNLDEVKTWLDEYAARVNNNIGNNDDESIVG